MAQLGFGCMRLPMIGGAEGAVDTAQFSQMIDAYLAAGFDYFDTAIVYLGGQSETALRECLVGRYPRESFRLTDKLSGSQFEKEEDIRPLFERQLANCGVEYFDCYLMHAMASEVYEKFKRCRAFETVAQLKAEGKVRRMGISFHDKPAVLERILTEHPEIELVQIQLNYLDLDNPSIESGAVYEVCRAHGKPILVMEPVKGGALAELPPQAQAVFDALGGGSAASYAIRYCAGFEGVETVLSGMSTLGQMHDNLSYMTDLHPLSDAEHAAIARVRTILKQENTVACTACRYCIAGCPMQIRIPDLLSCLNTHRRYADWGSSFYYGTHTAGCGKASDCIKCRQCEQACPQHLPITQLLQECAAVFETA